MQILNLDDKYRITTIHLNFVLQKYEEIIHRTTKEVRYDWKDIGYYGTNLAQALKRYTSEALRDDDGETDVHKVIARLKELEDVIERRVRKENIELIVVKKEKDE